MSAITCYSSRSCHGNLVKGDIVSSGKAGCCMNGGVLSFKDKSDGICHECFSMYSVALVIIGLGNSHLEIKNI